MKHTLIILACIGGTLYAAQEEQINPFFYANGLYCNSEWKKAYTEFKAVHKELLFDQARIKKMKEEDLIEGHVNFSDVAFARGAEKFNHNDYVQAQNLMLESCEHSAHRLRSNKFGRKPLNNEWKVGEDINGKKLLVLSERDSGAFGDTFYASWALQYAKEKGAFVIFVPQKPLAKLYDKQYLPNTLQAQYVDQIALRETEFPYHDKAIYLWSILHHYISGESIVKCFPISPCLSGIPFNNEKYNAKIEELTQLYGHAPFLVGGWWASSGSTFFAADNRKLERDLGVHKMLKLIDKLPVLFINLQGLGKVPLSQEELNKRRENGTAGLCNEFDVTTYPTDNVFNFGDDFDKEIPFGDTLGVMEMIKNNGGILIGCDTSLANAAAMIPKNGKKTKRQVFVLLNKKADMRWGSDLSPLRLWHHSDEVIVFQARNQDQWDNPLQEAQTIIQHRVAKHAKKLKASTQ